MAGAVTMGQEGGGAKVMSSGGTATGEGGAGGHRSIDPFFEVVRDGQWNACVGKQGSEQNYVDGYLEAAQELVAAVIDKRLFGSRDTLAMPILYNARHAIELSLKFVIKRLHGLGAIASPHRVDHDILSHWTHLRDAQVGDERIRQLVGELEPYVASLARIDDDGQELRYAEDRGGKRSLDDLAVVNLRLIRISLRQVGKILTRLKYRVLDFDAERGTGTFTARCSREDLKAIAAMVGDRATWREASFEERKQAVGERFGLSSRAFSDALNAIQRSRELATLVGVETPLLHISDEKATSVLRAWAELNPPYDPAEADFGIDLFDDDRHERRRRGKGLRSLEEEVIANLTVEEFSDLEALFYLGRGREFGECYDAMVGESARKNRLEKDRWGDVHHLLSKTNLLDEVVIGCRLAGRPSLGGNLRAIRPEPEGRN